MATEDMNVRKQARISTWWHMLASGTVTELFIFHRSYDAYQSRYTGCEFWRLLILAPRSI